MDPMMQMQQGMEMMMQMQQMMQMMQQGGVPGRDLKNKNVSKMFRQEGLINFQTKDH